jgi:hypothetical protein
MGCISEAWPSLTPPGAICDPVRSPSYSQIELFSSSVGTMGAMSVSLVGSS